MYGASLDFSGVTLPGVGGQINASNAISGDQLSAMNKTELIATNCVTGI